MYCTNCGALNREGYAFCTNCGAPLLQQPPSQQVAARPGQQAPHAGAVPQPRPAQVAQPCQAQVAQPRQAQPQARPVPQPRPAQAAQPQARPVPQPRPAVPAARPAPSRPAPSSSELPRIVPDRPRSSNGPQLTLVRSNGTRYRITEFPAAVGKGAASNVRISGNTAISRVHVLINFLGNGFSIEDKASTNGTRINGNMLQPGEYVRLHSGDRLTLGDEDFLVEL